MNTIKKGALYLAAAGLIYTAGINTGTNISREDNTIPFLAQKVSESEKFRGYILILIPTW